MLPYVIPGSISVAIGFVALFFAALAMLSVGSCGAFVGVGMHDARRTRARGARAPRG